MKQIKKDLAKAGGYREVCSAVLKRYVSIFRKDEVLEALGGLEIILDRDTMEIIDYNCSGIVLWDRIFEQILAKKGMQWLIVMSISYQKNTIFLCLVFLKQLYGRQKKRLVI